jgi:predicted acyl esterase
MYQVPLLRKSRTSWLQAFRFLAIIGVSWVMLCSVAVAEDTSENNATLKQRLREFPEADADKNGVLTAAELQTYAAKVRKENPRRQRSTGEIELPAGASRKSQMVPMRDGVKIATEVLLPAGDGPWPVLLFRTPYGRFSSLQNVGLEFLKAGVAFVSQDFRGLYDSEGSFDRFTHEIDDGYDSVEWVAKQPWCNGKVAMTGGSGPGIGAKLAMVGKPPHLVAVATVVAASNMHQYIHYHGGVFREMMNDRWFAGQGQPIPQWPKPRTATFTEQDSRRTLAANAAEMQTALLDSAGWYDIFLQSAIDDFVALKHTGKAQLIISGSGHGELSGLTYPKNAMRGGPNNPWLLHQLTGAHPEAAQGPPVRYYLMGDTMNPGAPGNTWKQADTWPIAHTATSFYFTKTNGLQTEIPAAAGSLTYQYDPKNPVPTIGGAELFPPKGPMDQTPLLDRKDILRFETPVLERPLEITGRVSVELSIGSDVPDTTFMAKLIDVYPNGYQALVADSAVMARYWNGFDKPAPLEKERTYQLTVDLWSMALMFDKGHRIAVHVTSSNWPRYEVHPNSYEPVNSYLGAPIANNTVHLGGQHAARLILPVIEPGTSRDYEWPKCRSRDESRGDPTSTPGRGREQSSG